MADGRCDLALMRVLMASGLRVSEVCDLAVGPVLGTPLQYEAQKELGGQMALGGGLGWRLQLSEQRGGTGGVPLR